MTSQSRGYFTLSAHQRPMVGDIKMAGTSFDHLGWMRCDGRNLPVAQYNQLFQIIGYSFTSNGVDTSLFGIPNAAGRVPGIVGTGLDTRNVSTTFTYGQSYGEYQHQLVVAEMPSHTHTVIDPGHKHPVPDPGHAHNYTVTNTDGPTYTASPGNTTTVSGQSGATTSTAFTGIVSTAISTTGITNAYTGGDQAHNNIQPTIAIGNMFIYSGYGRNSAGVTDQALWPYGIGTNLQ
jgi:microcystin-dependent protein